MVLGGYIGKPEHMNSREMNATPKSQTRQNRPKQTPRQPKAVPKQRQREHPRTENGMPHK